MTYKTLNEYKEELHPWKPFIPLTADKLILGTFPTAENNRGAYEFFYPNPNNDFWKIIFAVDNKNIEDYKSEDPVTIRKQVLSNLNLGIADIGYKILRQRGSSKDQNIFPIQYTDIFELLDNKVRITKIIITSGTVLSWFHHYCEINNHEFKVPKEKLPTQTKLSFKGRTIDIHIISSPSRLSPIKGEKLNQMYRETILNA